MYHMYHIAFLIHKPTAGGGLPRPRDQPQPAARPRPVTRHFRRAPQIGPGTKKSSAILAFFEEEGFPAFLWIPFKYGEF